MKRTVLSDTADGRILKRANSSLFSIATLVDDDPNASDATSGLMKSSSNLPLVNGESEDITSAYSALKGSGLVPLDCCDGDGATHDDDLSSSCSSSGFFQPEEMNGLCDSSPSAQGAEPGPEGKRGDRRLCASSLSPRRFNSKCHTKCKEKIQAVWSSDLLTGLVFESAPMHFDRHSRFHKERPARITSVQDYLTKTSIYERCNKKSLLVDSSWLDRDDFLRVHLPGYMQRLDQISKCSCHRLDVEAQQFKSMYFTNDSVREAKAAVSSLCNLVSRVVSGDLDNGFAVVRPPGHHAEPGLAGGYCVINNIAVAAAYAQEKLGMKKILIVDWDVHHGNGTQRCFFDSSDVLYFSVHRYNRGNFFPFTQQGGPTYVGRGKGEGFNINVGWNDKKMDDYDYLVVWEKLLMPVAGEFQPDLVLVSAGFDAAQGDMGECNVSPAMFGRLTRRLKTLANGKVVCALEGGYVRSVLCKCVESVLASLLDANSDAIVKREIQSFYRNLGDEDMLDCINPSAAESIRASINAHSKYWNCLRC